LVQVSGSLPRFGFITGESDEARKSATVAIPGPLASIIKTDTQHFNKLNKKTKDIIAGSLMVFVNFFWVRHFALLYYGYHYTDILYFFMYPDWILFLNITIGLTGILIGTLLIINHLKLRTALLTDMPLLIIGFILSLWPTIS
jgi:hypothetical protein